LPNADTIWYSIMDTGLDSHYDAIVIGTGLVESIVAAALAKGGKTVLHLDKNPFYGGEWATFNLEGIMDWAATITSMEGAPLQEIAVGSDFDPVVLLEILKETRREHRRKQAEKAKELAEQEREDNEEDGGVEEEKGGGLLKEMEEVDDLNAETYEGWELECMPVLSQPRAPSILSQKVDCAESSQTEPNKTMPNSPSHPSWEQKQMQADDTKPPASLDSAAMHPAFFGYSDPPPPDPRPSFEHLLLHSRRFSLDLSARLVLGSGISVNTMVRSGIGRYMEFKSIEGLYMGVSQEHMSSSDTEKFTRVPCLKGDMVKSKMLNVIEKRLLMRFIQYCTDWGRQQEGEDVTTQNERELGQGRSLNRPQNKETQAAKLDATPFIEGDRPFVEFLDNCKLTPRVQRLVIYALALTPRAVAIGASKNSDVPIEQKPMSTLEGLQAVYRHLRGLGQYGETAFLASLYGSSEIPQAFCRTAAVNGGIYMLGNSISSIVREKHSNRVVAVVDESGSIISCDMVICSPDYLSQIQESEQKILRRISVCTASEVQPGEGESTAGVDRLAFVLPPDSCPSIGNSSPVHVIALDHGAEVCPQGLRVVHFTTLHQPEDPAGVLERAAAHLFQNWPGPTTGEDAEASTTCHEAWAIDIALPLHTPFTSGSDGNTEEIACPKLPSNLVVCPRTSSDLCMFRAFEEAKVLFQQLCPGQEFFAETNFEDTIGEKDFDEHLLESALQNAVEDTEKAVDSTHMDKLDNKNITEPHVETPSRGPSNESEQLQQIEGNADEMVKEESVDDQLTNTKNTDVTKMALLVEQNSSEELNQNFCSDKEELHINESIIKN